MMAFRRFSRNSAPRFSRCVSQVLAEPTAWNQAPVVVSTLPNGVRVATKETFGEVASVGVYLNAGSRNETKATSGTSFALEHLASCGTAKRPKDKLETEIESIGASLDVSAGREQTAFTMSLLKGDVAQGVDILSDLVLTPGIAAFGKEKANIIRKADTKDAPTRQVIEDRLHACAFRDCSLSLPTVGPFEGLETLSEAELKAYVAANWTSENMVIAAAGPMKHEELVKLASAKFGSVKAGTPPPVAEKPYFCGAELVYRNDEMGPLAYISVGFEAVPWKSGDAVTFMVMQHIIGNYKRNVGVVPGSISGNRTINAVANKMGVGCAEEFQAFNRFYRDTGMFGFYIVADEVAVEHAIGELMFGCNLMSFSITDEEVERAKRELKASLFSAPTSAEAACKDLGTQVLAYNRGLPASEMILRIDAIDSEEIKRVAWKYLNDAEVSTTALGPLHGMPQYYALRQQTVMHRY
mmetsp:Transcript_67857/g.147858  ORF Transcript_67857/g.147858 Transcript_67857/m.147858 type:complete len:468 (-) Transcript_67857:116-1519(-)